MADSEGVGGQAPVGASATSNIASDTHQNGDKDDSVVGKDGVEFASQSGANADVDGKDTTGVTTSTTNPTAIPADAALEAMNLNTDSGSPSKSSEAAKESSISDPESPSRISKDESPVKELPQKPLLVPDYDAFLNLLRQPEAAGLTFELKSFLAAFRSQKRPLVEQRRAVASFLENIYAETIQNTLFSHVTEDEDLENIREGWEKLLMIKLYDATFGGPGTDEHKMTDYLNKKIQTFSWVQERHLDLTFQLGASLELAQAEMLRVNGFRCPKDKLTIFMNVLQIVVDLIKKQNMNASSDDLLPILILVIIRSNPPDLISNLKYIMRFRNQTELEKGNIQFCVTSMMSAISFIYNMKLQSLTLTPQELEQYGGKFSLPQRLLPSQPKPPTALKTSPTEPYSPVTATSRRASVPPRSSSAIAIPGTTTADNIPTASTSPSSGGFLSSASPPAASAIANTAAVAAKGLNGMMSQTFRIFEGAGAVIRSAAETAVGTVDGFAQGLMEKFKEDPNTTSSSAESSNSDVSSPSSLRSSNHLRSGSPGGIPPHQYPHHPSPLPPILTHTSTSTRSEIINSPSTSRLPPPHLPPRSASSQHTPTSATSAHRFDSPADLKTFEAALSDAERGILEDYELQLALALSISMEQQEDGEKALLGGSPLKTEVACVVEGDDDDEDDEVPLSVKKKRHQEGKMEGPTSPVQESTVQDLLS
ncbi:hypothetical protein HDV05_006504 [Chytridiales sp. JEL 0842]|nr:hypothetical protein HDV05_006504 [Chytridiales sp. JEL 0842]